MGVIGGIGGHISQDGTKIACVRTWGINLTAALQAAVCSATGGATKQVAGNKDWTGQYAAYGHIPEVLPGDNFEFEGAITGVDDSAIGASGDALCESVTINWDFEGGGIINHQVGFGADGALTQGTVTVPADTATPDPPTAAGRKVEIATDPFSSFSEINEVRTATLVLTRANPSYVSSQTSSQTKRIMGNLSATLALSCYAKDTDGWETFPQPNIAYAVKVYTSDDEFWLLKWIMMSELGGMDVDIEAATIVGCTLNGAFSAIENQADSPTVGVITKPGGGDVWP